MGDSFEWPWRWGIVCPQKCKYSYFITHIMISPYMVRIYNALKRKKFKETYWQYVYQNQIGGLIRQYGKGILEIHVRFFNDNTIYAEIEIGRIVQKGESSID